jgi:hypothetical protein
VVRCLLAAPNRIGVLPVSLLLSQMSCSIDCARAAGLPFDRPARIALHDGIFYRAESPAEDIVASVFDGFTFPAALRALLSLALPMPLLPL